MKTAIIILTTVFMSCGLSAPFRVELRERGGAVDRDAEFQLRPEQWQGKETAVVVCDMWDLHHCHNAVMRVKELVPRVNLLLEKVRSEGGVIIHAPSSCMDFYRDHPARLRAHKAPGAANVPEGINSWMHWINEEEKRAGYPIDHSDGGEDDDPVVHARWAEKLKSMGRNPDSPWVRQIESIQIKKDSDFITDSGEECWNIFEDNGVKNIMLVGVHTNMCVLGRPLA